MNDTRRKAIGALAKALDELRASLEDHRDNAEAIQAEEQEYYDNMPEGLQAGDRGEKAQEASEYLQTAFDALDAACSSLDEALEALSSATP
jgi:prefoldin subunit 5